MAPITPSFLLVSTLCTLSLPAWAVPHGGGKNSSSVSPSASASSSPSPSSASQVLYFPPVTYAPKPSGIPFLIQNVSAQPWLYRTEAPITHPTLSEDSICVSSNSTSGYWYEQIDHDGESSFMDSEYKDNYEVFRNVVDDFGADNTGDEDAAPAIQAAIQAGPSNGPDRGSHSMGTTGQPAIIYLPSGTYLMKSSLQLFVGTVIIGDPTDPPVLKATLDFADDHIIYGKDPNFGGTINFYIGIKNIIIDSTDIDVDSSITLLDWTVSQATQLTNVGFNMPNYSTGHVGLTTQYDYNSNLILNDLWFRGGAIGMKLSGQQWVFKNISFTGTTTGVQAGGTDIVFLGCRFESGALGIDAQGTSGSLTVVDTTGVSMGTLVSSSSTGNAGNSIVLDNVQNSGTTVKLGGRIAWSGNVPDTWVHGNLYASKNAQYQYSQGKIVSTSRSSSLLSGKNYFTMAPPTYQDYDVGQVLNIKNVPGLPVYGDGETDDTRNINDILSRYKTCSLIYFPAGTYLVTDTIFVPAGTRIIGDPFASTISAVGSNFEDESAVRSMFRVGYPGDVGVAQVSDMLFTVADVLPGCQLVEINIAARSPGDVGFWNTHFRIGGAVGSQVESKCTDSPEDCKAAWGLLHLSTTSSAYIENMWGWTADHDLDGDNPQTISTGRGVLVEGTAATWLIGTGFEHNTLYQYNFQYARNVFTAMQQSESPYWQGPGSSALNPAPWDEYLAISDPTYNDCAADDSKCRMALFERIYGSSDLFLYGGCNWVFFNDNGDCSGDCQTNAIEIVNSTAIYLYGTNTKSTTNMVMEGNKPIALESDNAGGWGGVIAGYLYDA